MNAPFKTDGLPQWRLDDLYTSREDPRIEADLAESEQLNRELARLEGRMLATRARPAELGGIIDRGIQLRDQRRGHPHTGQSGSPDTRTVRVSAARAS